MTDLLTEEDELLSQTESVPVAAVEPSKIGLECPECGATKGKMGLPFLTKAALGTHRATIHGVYSEDPKKQRKRAAPKKSPAKNVSRETSRPTTPRTPTRRPLGESLARIILQVGRIVNSIEPPTGAAIMFEAGALGEAVDKLVAGTFIDKPLQKGASVAEKFEPLVPLVTMPAMVFMLSHNPALESVLEGELREALEDVLVQSLPLLRRRATRTKQTVDALAELKVIDPNLASSDDPIGDILHDFFAMTLPPSDMPQSPDGSPES